MFSLSARRAAGSAALCLVLALCCVGVSPSSSAALVPVWAWPLPPPHVVVGHFVAPETPYAAGHRGVDVGGSAGDAVVAPAAGVVHFAGWVVDRSVVSIRHVGGLISSFEPVAASVAVGDAVERGQVVGVLQAGHCAAPCLHFGVRRHGEYVSPLLFLGGIPRSVLLPTRAID